MLWLGYDDLENNILAYSLFSNLDIDAMGPMNAMIASVTMVTEV